MSTTPGERRALLFLGAIAALGGGVRLLGGDAEIAATPESIAALQRQIGATESAAAASTPSRSRTRSRSRSPRSPDPDSSAPPSYGSRIRPLTDAELMGRAAASPAATARQPPPPELAAPRGALVNVNTASAAELQALPGIGPALAERIVRDRAESGAYVNLTDLDRVRGIGPAMLRKLGPLVTF